MQTSPILDVQTHNNSQIPFTIHKLVSLLCQPVKMGFIKGKKLRLMIKKLLLRKNKVQDFESSLKNRSYPAVGKYMYHFEVALPTALQ